MKYKYLCAVFIFLILTAFIGGCVNQFDGDTNDTLTDTDTNINTDTNIKTTETSEISSEEEPVSDKSNIIEIIVFDIGKADAIIITTENHTVMIDTGENKHGPAIANYFRSRKINKIDYMIITHFHKDHVGGARTILRNLTVNQVIVPDYGKESKQYNRFIQALNDRGVGKNILKETVKFTLDDVEFILYPSRQEYREYIDNIIPGEDNQNDDENENDDYDEDEAGENDGSEVKENDFSIVVSVKHGVNNFLFAGDAMAERIGELLATDDILETKYDFLKVPHHGKYNSRSLEFINAINPKYAVITCSFDKPADDRVVSALESIGADIYFTKNGDVCFISDGESLILFD